MNVVDAIRQRRAYRAIEPVPISDETVEELARAAQLAPSCSNNQPWRFVFVRSADQLEKMFQTLSKGNSWAFDASMIIAACCRREDDCIIPGRDYFQFDTGLAVAFILLRATELGLLTHPIAGYDEQKVRQVLEVPADASIINLIIVGEHSLEKIPTMSPKMIDSEQNRPPRLPLEKIAMHDRYAVPE